ncbi:MAG: hybrid sensor histidine kinase/response regulator [Cyanobacteria bacterium P01_C01_bin.72]
MDTEQQIRLNFLDEAEEYFDRIESNLLGLSDALVDPHKVDLVLRSAHSIKGGAAMMSLNTLSHVAHRLEDFLKILRVRYTADSVDVEVETLLLQSVDCLRHLGSLNRQELSGIDAENSHQQKEAVSDRIQPIFDKLQEYLGDLQASDENALLAQDEDVNPALLIFEEGVDEILDRFESQLSNLETTTLASEIIATAQELMGFGNMANLESFTQLCESIRQEAGRLAAEDMPLLAEQSLKTWRRSHALVIRGSIDKLPTCLENLPAAAKSEPSEAISPEPNTLSLTFDEAIDFGATSDAEQETDSDELFIDDAFDFVELQSAFDSAQIEEVPESAFAFLEDNGLNLDSLQSAFNSEQMEEIADSAFDPLADNGFDLNDLQSAFAAELVETDAKIASDAAPPAQAAPVGLQSASVSELESASTASPTQPQQVAAQPNSLQSSIDSPLAVEQMVRVPASQLKQFKSLFEQLVLNRNNINLRLQQLQNIIALMSQRISQMEISNAQLKQWYDRATLEGVLTSSATSLLTNQNSLLEKRQDHNQANSDQGFDSLEMDQYSDIHLICQEQIETIVQLQEVASDIELGLQEINQATRELNYTTKSMQGNVTRTQMLPFARVVRRFPRVIRDLNLQFDKKVDLKVIGESTLLDRFFVEALSDPLMHLLRNAFDHGIEDAATRIAAGKSETGTITIQASNQGTYTVINISDDGGGIPLSKIRDRLTEMGFSASEIEQIPEAELLDFIFDPGFSTAKQVTELSGRGVGMDVVRTNLQKIQGDVRVSTKPGQGTTFTLKIPFTLSILRVAIVEQAGIVFAIPINSVRELVPLDPEQVNTLPSGKYFSWNQSEIPLVEIEKSLVYRRHSSLNLTGNPAINRTMAVIIEDEDYCGALQISRFWQEQELTTRTIDSPVPLPVGIISSVVFGDGRVIPLVDPAALIRECLNNPNNSEPSTPYSNHLHQSIADTVLIVDDSINVRRYLSLTLEKAGYQTEQAKDGQEAVDKLVGGLPVDAVICDIEMPRLDGYGVLEEIKQRSEFSDLPIAMLTSRSNEKHRKLAFNLGASAYFSKPYDERQLLEKLSEIMADTRSKSVSV